MSTAAIRSAEADRLSSCRFADAAAAVAISTYKDRCPEELRRSYKQTVLAAFVLLVPNYTSCAGDSSQAGATADSDTSSNHTLEVVSLGVGTKFLSIQQLIDLKNTTAPDSITCKSACLKDMHAEVLAKRGFQRFLMQECLIALTAAVNSNCAPSRYIEVMYTPSVSLRLREGITVHLYTSSQPCGNASIKRWAKGKAPTQHSDLKEDQFPIELHPALHFTAVHEGQVALLVKGGVSSGVVGIESKTGDAITAELIADIEKKAQKIEYLPGTFPASLWPFRVGAMTCSDKIAKWNALGVQGGLLCNILSSPIYLSTCVVGRKYSHPHLCRALCCRLNSYAYPPVAPLRGRKRKEADVSDGISESTSTTTANETAPNPVALYTTHHPSMLCTSVKFDDSAIVTAPSASSSAFSATPCTSIKNIVTPSTSINNTTPPSSATTSEDVVTIAGANFGESRCFVYVRGSGPFDDVIDIIDSKTGLLVDADAGGVIIVRPSAISGSALHAMHNQLIGTLHSLRSSHSDSSDGNASSDANKDSGIASKESVYNAAKLELFGTLFKDWIR